MQLSVVDRMALFEHNYAILRAREATLVKEVSGCVGFGATARDRICGLSAVEAPNPWVGKSNEKCRGFDTLSARYGDFCGYWDSRVRFCAFHVPVTACTSLSP
jgi:hypothetical protein